MARFECRTEALRRSAVLGVPAAALSVLLAVAGCGGGGSSSGSSGLPNGKASQAQVVQGRNMVTSMGCTDCHNRGKDDPTDPQWMAGYVTGGTQGIFNIGPFTTYAANLTPDTTTGIGKYTDTQIFYALRYGLDPATTAGLTITGTSTSQGFPADPHYLAPPMPWPATRHLSDSDTWAIVAYLKHGIKAVSNTVPDSQGPPDHWQSSYTATAVGPATFPAYPEGNEQYNP